MNASMSEPMPRLRRRELLKALGCSGVAAAGGGLHHMAFAAEPAPDAGSLVVVFLRGGADGLHLAAPVDDPDYVAARPADLRVAEGGSAPGLRLPAAFAPGRDCRLHPAAAPLLELFGSGHAQLLHACALEGGTRSHFAAQERLEAALPPPSPAREPRPEVQGWIAPLLRDAAAPAKPGVACVSTTARPARALLGAGFSLNLAGELRDALALPGGAPGRAALEALYAAMPGEDPLAPLGRQTLHQLALLEARMPRVEGGARLAPYAPPAGVQYDAGNRRWMHDLQTVAQLIRMDVGLRVACVDLGGWDTHEGQPARLAPLVRQWARNLRALFDDLQAGGRPATVLVMSEFGRRLRANGSSGTDHGHGNVLWSLDTRGRALLPPTDWPGLAIEQLDNGLDLKATREVRAVLRDVGKKVLAGEELHAVG
ncbi:DUF1501 domain-containing protein [Azohydromonas australica]|uniref:DUF1501 domain-containing protein n=1 Tax=Azohydromonas australica TaxID=364039 RepID=UPI0004122115|nr:DUF1501 domain-containing protein [Azohydromonas australica]